MRRSIAVRIAATLGLAVAAVPGCGHAPAGPPAPALVARPRLVVLLVIDQLPSWAFTRDRALFTGGLGRLLREGAVVPTAELPYVNTFTAPGHATIGTGAPPAVHGILGNTWYRRDTGTDLPAEFDAQASTFGLGDRAGTALPPASGAALRVDGLADQLRTTTAGRARSVAIGLKARAACLIAGRHPDLAIWYDAAAGGMTTSRAYAAQLPPWLDQLAAAHPTGRFVGQVWTPLDPALLARATGVLDERPGEGDVHGLGTTFPHPVVDAEAIVQTPFGDEVVFDAVDAALARLDLGHDDVPDLLAISLNAHDYIGHTFGPESWEILDATLRLDRRLGAWFAVLDRQLGADGWAIVVTSDHGATPLPEGGAIAGARRIPPRDIEAAAEAALVAALGAGPWIADTGANQVFFTARWAAVPDEARTPALAAAAAAVAALPGVERVIPTAALLADCGPRTGLERAACQGLAPDLAGELLVVPLRGSSMSAYATGTHHDAPSDDNRQVPVLVRAPGLAAQTGTGSLLQVAPTVAALLGIPAPPAATAPALFGLDRRR